MSDNIKVKNDAIEILLESAIVVKEKIIEYVKEYHGMIDTIDFINTVFYEELQI